MIPVAWPWSVYVRWKRSSTGLTINSLEKEKEKKKKNVRIIPLIDSSELYRHCICRCPDHDIFWKTLLKLRNHPFTRHASAIPQINFFLLLADSTLVESQLLTLQDVTVDTTALARAGGDDGVQTTGLKLLLDGGLNLAVVGEASSLLLHDAVALLLGGGLGGLLLASPADGLAVVSLVPLSEGSGINLNDGGLGQGVGADQFVVGGVVGHNDDTGLAGDALGTPREVARLETEGTELAVTTTGADQVDSLSTNTGVGRLATLLERPAVLSEMSEKG